MSKVEQEIQQRVQNPSERIKWVHPDEVEQLWRAQIGTPLTEGVKRTNAYRAFHINVTGCRPIR